MESADHADENAVGHAVENADVAYEVILVCQCYEEKVMGRELKSRLRKVEKVYRSLWLFSMKRRSVSFPRIDWDHFDRMINRVPFK